MKTYDGLMMVSALKFKSNGLGSSSPPGLVLLDKTLYSDSDSRHAGV